MSYFLLKERISRLSIMFSSGSHVLYLKYVQRIPSTRKLHDKTTMQQAMLNDMKTLSNVLLGLPSFPFDEIFRFTLHKNQKQQLDQVH
jgi:hypothetical protein